MKQWQFVGITVLSAMVLLASIWLVYSMEENRALEQKIQVQAQQLRAVQQLQGASNNLLRSMIQVSTKNENMRALLARHGINVNIKPPAADGEKQE